MPASTIDGRLAKLRSNLCNIDLDSKIHSTKQLFQPRYMGGANNLLAGNSQAEEPHAEALKMSILEDLREVNESTALQAGLPQPHSQRNLDSLAAAASDPYGRVKGLAQA